ncbi:hypothetical protein [Aurantiacibacter poecillastricola]|uniref:hypothetical protein n=1 Tax=Aurantiacibacter poecillastricola TaxID=3064385 RepID=UPI00273F09E0|nr:hypothetical protein [Aurantiacibacter sp. 219JJ12-13]MDP5261012.1 hypothetical protein [Aurantiacibacter sp. 219JJ12-13]
MKNFALPALLSAALLSGCATPAYVSPVEVTRFVGAQPAYLAQGTIQIVPEPGLAGESLEYGVYRDAVARELQELGYRVVMVNGSQIAQLSIGQFVTGENDRRGPVDVGVGGSTGTYGSGLGVGIGFNLGGTPAERIAREMSVSIRAAGGTQNLWEGRAAMTATANSEYAQDSDAALRLADALFQNFPGQSGETIEVE